jgi:hypothetical protein
MMRLRDDRARAARLLIASLVLAMPLAALAIGDSGRGADGKFEKRASSHFVLLQDVDIDRSSGFRGSRRFEQQLLAELEVAYKSLDERLGLRPERPIEVYVYDPAIFDAQFAGLFKFPAAGFYGGVIRVRGETVVTDALVRTLHHELVHAALDAEAPHLIHPAWLNEGLAEWFEARTIGKRRLSTREEGYLGTLAAKGRLFSLADLSAPNFGHLGPDGARLAYLQSYAFMEYLARSHGERRLRDVVSEYVRSGDLYRAFRRTYRADLEQLEQRHLGELGWTG